MGKKRFSCLETFSFVLMLARQDNFGISGAAFGGLIWHVFIHYIDTDNDPKKYFGHSNVFDDKHFRN